MKSRQLLDPPRRRLAGERTTTMRTVLRPRSLRTTLVAFAGFSAADQAFWLSLLLYAYQRGGVSEAGMVSFALLIPAGLAAPIISTAADVVPRRHVLSIGYIVLAVTLLATGVAMVAGLPSTVVYGLATTVAVVHGFAAPAVTSTLPGLCSTPDELTAGNVALGFVEQSGRLVGPLAAGAILAFSTPGGVVVAMGLLVVSCAVMSALLVRGVSFESSHDDDPDRSPLSTTVGGGIQVLRANGSARSVVLILGGLAIVVGVIDVSVAAIAVEVLGRGEGTVSVLAAALGLGSMLGVLATMSLVGLRREIPTLALGVAASAVALGVLGMSGSLILAVTFCLVLGSAGSMAVIAGKTALQGLTPDNTLSRVFGVLESSELIGLAAGGLLVFLLAPRLDLSISLAAVAFGIVAIVITQFARLRTMDSSRRQVDPTLIRLMRSVPMFASLPPYVIESLVSHLSPSRLEPHSILIRRGTMGHHLFVVAEGHLVVSLKGDRTEQRNPGDYVGEIALLRGTVRTIDVAAGAEGATVWALHRDVFLPAIGSEPRSLARATREAERRLSRFDGELPSQQS